MKLRMLSLFSGIGAFEEALKNIGVDFELINYCEIDPQISKAYSLIHNVSEDLNLGDITKVDETKLKDFDLMTYGFPCQSFSVQGNRLGFEDETRGNLFFESMKIAKYKKPKYMVAENVKGLISHDKGNTFKIVLEILESIGYNNYYKVLRSCDFDIPQGRERIYIISIRKDIDDYNFTMPIGKLTDKTVEDIIEDFPRKKMKKSLQIYNNPKYFINKYKSDINIKKLFDGGVEGYFTSNFAANRIFSIKGISPTLTTKNDAAYNEIDGLLTGRERFKLQGFNPDYVDILIENGLPEGLMVKLSGNTITVNVLEEIFKNLFLKV